MRYYFMGICGTAMGNVAVLLKQSGHEVLGADTGIYPPMSNVLAAAGIDVLPGYDPARLERIAPDCVVVGNVISRGNPEVEWLLAHRRFPFISMPELIGRELIGSRISVVITGTHGKTTTSAMAATLLRAAGTNPGWLVGGVPLDLPGGCAAGHPGAPFVIEGDEYDSAFFDKRSKFIHYRPRILVLNNLEYDHADIFRDLEDIRRTFAHVIRIVPNNGYILYNGDDPNLRELVPVDWAQCYAVGTGTHCDLRIVNYAEGPEGASFHLRWRGALWDKIQWRQHGEFNARNAAMAALAAGLAKNPDDPLCAISPSSLNDIRGVRRRQEIVADTPHCTVIEDFAHHPTAIAATLRSLQARWPGHKLVACFEPRSNTARRSIFQHEFAAALAHADSVCIGAILDAHKAPEGQRLDPAALASELHRDGAHATAFDDNEALLASLIDDSGSGPRLVVFLTNGSFGGIIRRFADTCCSAART